MGHMVGFVLDWVEDNLGKGENGDNGGKRPGSFK